MNILQEYVKGYLETLGYGFPEKKDDFIIADKVDFGGVRDTRLIWTPTDPEHEWEVTQIEIRLKKEFEEKTNQYPNARGWVIAETFGGYSQEFRTKAASHKIHLRVPIQFFDAAFKYEDAPQYLSAITELRNPPPRIPQPYSIIRNGDIQETGDDLLEKLWDEIRFNDKPSLRIVVGPAGIGKTWLFKALFSRLYRHFLDEKNKQEVFPRPIPLIPSYLKGAGSLRTGELLRSFIETEVASPIRRGTFEWLVTHGYAIWLFDGLDELYSEDPDFFNNLADILTRPNKSNLSQILVCARESLITSCEPFSEFLSDYFDSSEDPQIQIYRLEGWEHKSKRTYAELIFDPPEDQNFVTYISRTESLRSLSKLAFYCDLLRNTFKLGKQKEFTDDFSLLNYAVTEIIEREKNKGLLKMENFTTHGLDEWLESVAEDFFASGYKGIDRLDIEIYAKVVLVPNLSEQERENAITTLVQFPLFAPGAEPGILTFEHELIAEYLAGRYWSERLIDQPHNTSHALGHLPDLPESLIARYIAGQLSKEPGKITNLIEVLRIDPPSNRGSTNLLQLVLMASSAKDILAKLKQSVEGQDLSHIEFENRDLEGFSFRNCDLSNTIYKQSIIINTKFEGARLSGTRFEGVSKGDLKGAQFGDLIHFDFVFINGKHVEDRMEFAQWVEEMTGDIKPILEPCPSAVQLHTLFLKYIRPDGSGRRDDLPSRALARGKRQPGAPEQEDIIEACISAGYLQNNRSRDRIRRVPGDRYNNMVDFVKDWEISKDTRVMLDSLCTIEACEHVPIRAIS